MLSIALVCMRHACHQMKACSPLELLGDGINKNSLLKGLKLNIPDIERSVAEAQHVKKATVTILGLATSAHMYQ